MHNKRIINAVWWALLHEGVPVVKTATDSLGVDSEYIYGDCLLTSSSFIWLSPAKNSTQFFTEASTAFYLKGEINIDKLFKSVKALGEYWTEWSSEHNINVRAEYLHDRMRECICDMLNERGVPAQLFNDGNGVAVHICTLVSYDFCYFDMRDSVTCKEDVTTDAHKRIRICSENMDAIMSSLAAFAERYAALPNRENIETAEHVAPETMKDVVAQLGATLDDGRTYRKTCAKCLSTITEGLEVNPDDERLWHLHSKFVNSMKEIE